MIKKGIILILNIITLYLKSILKKNKPNVFLLIFQNPNIGGGTTYFYMITEYLLKRKKRIVLFLKQGEITSTIEEYCDKKDIEIIIFQDEIKFMASENISIKFIYNYIKQIYFLLKHYNEIKPEATFLFSGWPFMLFKALYLPGNVFFSQHVMPLQKLDRGNKLFYKFAAIFPSNYFISVSNFSRNKIFNNWSKIGKKRHYLVYNYFEKQNQVIEERNNNSIQVLCLAQVSPVKNPLLFIEIANVITQKYNNVKFVWAGTGTLLNECIQLTRNNSQIKFVGFQKDVDTLYANSDLYINIAKSETHGISVVGAMAYGLPCVVTNNGGTVESVQDSETGYIVDVTNKDLMIERLDTLLNNETLRQQMGEKARKRYKKMFTKEIWEQKMNKILK